MKLSRVPQQGGDPRLHATVTNAIVNLIDQRDQTSATAITASTYTCADTDGLVLLDCTSNAITVTLPYAEHMQRKMTFIKIDASANAVTLTRKGSDTINGATTATLTAQWSTKTLWPDRTSKWYIVATI